jgi:hypothetical protein
MLWLHELINDAIGSVGTTMGGIARRRDSRNSKGKTDVRVGLSNWQPPQYIVHTGAIVSKPSAIATPSTESSYSPPQTVVISATTGNESPNKIVSRLHTHALSPKLNLPPIRAHLFLSDVSRPVPQLHSVLVVRAPIFSSIYPIAVRMLGDVPGHIR